MALWLQPSSTIPRIQEFDWKQIMKTSFLLLKAVGLWPEGEGYKFEVYTLWAIICITIFTFGHTFFQVVNIIFVLDDLKLVVSTFYMTSTEVLIVLKVYYIVKNMKTLKALVKDFKLDIFQPKNQEQIKITDLVIKFWKKTTFMYWSTANMTLIPIALAPILDSEDYMLPFLAWYPFNTKISPNYEITFGYQMLGVAINANTVISIDILIAALLMYLAAQYDILCDDIRHLYDEDRIHVKEKLKKCVNHHWAVLEFAEKTSKFLQWIIFGQFFISAISIGLTLFLLTTAVPLSSDFLKFLGFLFSMMLEIFLYCWFGNEVQVKSNNVTYSMFESDWIAASPKERQLMLILVERCQKPLKMSALNLFYLSLETFVKILRGAWSYFALLHQLSSRK